MTLKLRTAECFVKPIVSVQCVRGSFNKTSLKHGKGRAALAGTGRREGAQWVADLSWGVKTSASACTTIGAVIKSQSNTA